MKSEQKRLLEELRSALVGKLHTQPFTIYSDETIERLLEVQPKTLDELAKVKGFPANGKRIKCFGKAVIAIFNQKTELKKLSVFDNASSLAKKGKFFALAVILTGSICNPSVRAWETPLQQEISLTVAKNNFVEASKEQARKAWEVQQEKELKRRLKEEEVYEKSIEKKKRDWEKRVQRERESTLSKATKKVQEAASNALEASKATEMYAEKLKKKAEEKKKKRKQGYQVFSVGSAGNSNFKAWMDYKAITSVTSDQYKMQQNATTGEHGIRTLNGRYCIAVGSHYATTIGTKIDIVLESGTVLECVLGDQKANKDTDETNSYHECDGSYLEFIVDGESLDHAARISGDVSSIDGFKGKITEIRVWEE